MTAARTIFAAPPADTPPGSLHWLYRGTGASRWMTATWAGEGWNLMDGNKPIPPEELTWWRYVGPATPPDPNVSPQLRTEARDKTEAALAIAERALRRLVADASGSWRCFEAALRQDIGNTNYAVVADKVAEAERALADIAELRR